MATKNMVRWCLNKAKKELEIGARHRGLKKIEPNLVEAKKHLVKAEHNFDALLSFSYGFQDWAISAAFYTIYHSFLAIITKQGYESRNQECTVALMQQLLDEGLITISEEIIDAVKHLNHEEAHERNIISLREDFQYGTETSIDDNKLGELTQLCRQAIEEAKRNIYKK